MAIGRLMLAGLVSMAVSVAAVDDRPASIESLRHLAGVRVEISPLGPAFEREGLATSTLRADVEARLQQAGIRVLSDTEEAPGAPVLLLGIQAAPLGTAQPLYAVRLQTELEQTVVLARDLTIRARATTWISSGTLVIASRNSLSDVRRGTRDAVDEFIRAYRTANAR